MALGNAVIMSGGYLSDDIQTEYGRMPPSFLPFENKRLYEHQVRMLRRFVNNVSLAIPDDFEPEQFDIQRLGHLGVQIIKVSSKLEVHKSLCSVLERASLNIRKKSGTIVLMGDTLFPSLSYFPLDSLAVSSPKVDYAWDRPKDQDESDFGPVLSGLFSFSEPDQLVKSLKDSLSLVESIESYSSTTQMRHIEVKTWLDFGNLPNLYKSRKESSTARHFNNVDIIGLTVTKSSSNTQKISAEKAWFKTTPPAIRTYLPQLIAEGPGSYTTEYLPLPSLLELSVFGETSSLLWDNIASSIATFLELCSEAVPPNFDLSGALGDLSAQKTIGRLHTFSEQTGFDLFSDLKVNGQCFPPLCKIVQDTEPFITEWDGSLPGIIHGDLCFSNIFYDSRTQDIKVIDPRGSHSARGNYGHQGYDLAKLLHSLEGYDNIISNRFGLVKKDDYEFDFSISFPRSHQTLKQAFERHFVGPFSLSNRRVAALTIQLFLAMLPLHEDTPLRQKAFIGNACRLYRKWGFG